MEVTPMPVVEIARGDGTLVQCDTDGHTLSYYRYHVKFTPIEWKILKELYEAKPDSVERVELIKLIWGNGRVLPTRTIDVHISSISKKLAYIKGARIDSVYGTGYRLGYS
jgi:DNA-binding response OmpR family regulator